MTLIWLSLAHAANAPVVDRVAAVVNDEVIALSDVYDLGRDFVVQRCPAVDVPPEPAEAPAGTDDPGADAGALAPAPAEPLTPPAGTDAGPPAGTDAAPVGTDAAPVAPPVAPAAVEPTLGGEPVQPVVPGTINPDPTDPTVPSVSPTEPLVPNRPSGDAPVDGVAGGESPAATPPVASAETPAAPEPGAAAAPVTPPVPEPVKPLVAGAERCAAEAELEVLDALVRRVLIRQELARLEVDVTAADVDQAIDRTVRQYQLADRQALKVEVEASGKRWDQYRDELLEFLRTQAFQGRVLAPRVTITDDELNDLYLRTARKVTKPVAKVSGLGLGIPPGSSPEQTALVVTQAEMLVADLNEGKIAWEDAVKLYDAGAAGMFSGQEFSPGSIIEPLNTAIFTGPVGVVQPPLRMDNPDGLTVLFVLRVDEKTEKSEVAPFEEVKDQLKDQVFAEKLEDAEEEWYQRARREAAINVLLKVE